MKREKKRRQSARNSVGTGTTSLLMIFTVLCFATLAILSLSTAASNQRIQQRGINGTVALLEAEGEAAQKLAELDAGLVNASTETQAADTAKALGWEATDDGFVNTVRFDGEHMLQTEIVLEATANGVVYRIVRQQSSFTGDWSPALEGDLWQQAE